MKLNIRKYTIVAAMLFLIATVSTVEAKLQWDNNSELFESPISDSNNQMNGRAPFASDNDNKPALRAAPPGSGDGQKLPIGDGAWVLVGLALCSLVYGFKKRQQR